MFWHCSPFSAVIQIPFCFFSHICTLTTVQNCSQLRARSLPAKSLLSQWNTSSLNLPSGHCRLEVYTRQGNSAQALHHEIRKWTEHYFRKPHSKVLWGYVWFNAAEVAILTSWSGVSWEPLGCSRRGILDRIVDYKGLVNRKIKITFQQGKVKARLSKMLTMRKR